MNTGIRALLLAGLAGLLTAACDSDRSEPAAGRDGNLGPAPRLGPPTEAVQVAFRVSITNLTSGQPFSPPNLLVQPPRQLPWRIGAAAGGALEVLAESGDGSGFEATSNSRAVSEDVLHPGDTTSLEFTIPQDSTRRVTMLTMLVNTNDAFTGFTEVMDGMHRGARRTFTVTAYDAGTEANDEAAAAIPGPAGGGEGYNSSRDGDVDRVHRHPGVLTRYDLEGSALGAGHLFDNPVARVTVERL